MGKACFELPFYSRLHSSGMSISSRRDNDFQHMTGIPRACAPLISPLVHRPGCLWRAVRGVQLAGGHNAFEAGLVLFPGALAALVFAPDRSIPRDGGDGLSHRVLPTIGRVYGLPRRARVLGAPCARLPSCRHCEGPSQRQGRELVKRPPVWASPRAPSRKSRSTLALSVRTRL